MVKAYLKEQRLILKEKLAKIKSVIEKINKKRRIGSSNIKQMGRNIGKIKMSGVLNNKFENIIKEQLWVIVNGKKQAIQLSNFSKVVSCIRSVHTAIVTSRTGNSL